VDAATVGGDPGGVFQPWPRTLPTEHDGNFRAACSDPRSELGHMDRVARKQRVLSGSRHAIAIRD